MSDSEASDPRRAEELRGIAASPGVAAGSLLLISSERPVFSRRRISPGAVGTERARFFAAVSRASTELSMLIDSARKRTKAAELSILDAHLLMLSDPTLGDAVAAEIVERRRSAEWALDVAVGEMTARLRSSDDAYFRERSRDFESVGEMLWRALAEETPSVQAEWGEPRVIVARDLSPAQTASFEKQQVLGLITEVGSRSSHTAILARALDIPAVVGCAGALKRALNHDQALVFGSSGRVVLSPGTEVLDEAYERARKRSVFVSGLQKSRDLPARMRCGKRLSLLANIELPHEGQLARVQGARGVGLCRTEFLFMGRSVAPTEDEQYEAYCSVLKQMPGLPVVLRTFDLGGDKFLSLVPRREGNQELGFRGVRLALAHPEVLLRQLRAMLRASAHGALSIMVPLVTVVSEVAEVRRLFTQAVSDLDARGELRAAEVPLGCMIEVPAAALNARFLAQEADFLSVGTNDLVQYTCAVDRKNTELSGLANHFDPGVIKLLRCTLEGAAEAGKPVSVCGAMASDPFAAVILAGLGVRTLSMEAWAIPTIKESLRRVSLAEAELAAQSALRLGSSELVYGYLRDLFGDRLRDLAGFD